MVFLMKKNQKVYKLSIPSKITKIVEVEKFSGKISDLIRFCEEDRDNLAIAVTEAVNNAIIHGNKHDESKKVTITFSILKNGVRVGIKDEGDGFIPEKIKSPLLPENLFKDHGRGIFIVKSLMDKVEFKINKKKGTELVMTKYRSTS